MPGPNLAHAPVFCEAFRFQDAEAIVVITDGKAEVAICSAHCGHQRMNLWALTQGVGFAGMWAAYSGNFANQPVSKILFFLGGQVPRFANSSMRI